MKDNQDAYTIEPTFGDLDDQQAFFAVYDGHGKDGHHCARFASDNLPQMVLNKLKKIQNNSASPKAIKEALNLAHYTTNEAMHADRRFDDNLSGTTSISLLLRGRTMYISNVGDSRAIIATRIGDRVVAQALSSDQTPYRKDERERVKKYGARILSMDQIEGVEPVHENWGDLNLGEDIDEGGDPPRIWSPKGDYPGTAFTRSLGDLVAEECGVTAEPEISARDITAVDKFIILASDGVFEFLTNQMVVDSVCRYPHDPLAACRTIVEAAYNMWLQYEVRTDDITIIALYIEEVNSLFKPSSSSSVSTPVLKEETKVSVDVKDGVQDGVRDKAAGTVSVTASRPVRRTMSKEKKKHMITLTSTANLDASDDEEESRLFEEQSRLIKSETDQFVLIAAMKSNFLFHHLNASQRQAVVNIMQPVDVVAGELVIVQGETGDKFYVVDSGRFEVRVKVGSRTLIEGSISPDCKPSESLSAAERELLAGPLVHSYEANSDSHPGFGELSLLYGKPRAASVIAVTPGKLWALDRRIFRRLILRPKKDVYRKDTLKILQKVELFKCLDVSQLQRLVDLLQERHYTAGERIITQGEAGETFYVLDKGECVCTIDTLSSEDGAGTVTSSKVVMELKDNSYFGERALLESKPRAANVIAVKDCDCLCIDKAAFEEVLGPLKVIIDEDRQRRETEALITLSLPQTINDISIDGMIMNDSLGPLLLGRNKKNTNNKEVFIRSFLLSEVDKNHFKDSASRYLEACKLLQLSVLHQNKISGRRESIARPLLLPPCLSIIRQNNAAHAVFDTCIISDLSTFIRTHAASLLEVSRYVTFLFACITAALEGLHDAGIIYRAVQPEALYIDATGRVVLVDYRCCRLGLFNPQHRAFTICGVSDYLSPEQISQTGHSFPVDLWGMGVLLYELLVGTHPFSAATEVATYSKISSFGSKGNQSLKFPDAFPAETRALINQLLVPTPEARIGSGPNGFVALKRHQFFTGVNWERLIADETFASPILALARQEREEILADGLDASVLEAFDRPFEGSVEWLSRLEL